MQAFLLITLATFRQLQNQINKEMVLHIIKDRIVLFKKKSSGC